LEIGDCEQEALLKSAVSSLIEIKVGEAFGIGKSPPNTSLSQSKTTTDYYWIEALTVKFIESYLKSAEIKISKNDKIQFSSKRFSDCY
jgi:hypothetical protein